MNSRSVSELRQAAVNAGWDSDALASEILHKLTELESRPPEPTPAPIAVVPPAENSKALTYGLPALCLLLGLTLGVVFISNQQEAARKQYEATMQAKDAEIAKLTATGENLKAIANVLVETAKQNALAADSNRAAINTYMDKLDELNKELERLKAAKPADVKGGGEAKPAGQP